jgi:hypothetical protein
MLFPCSEEDEESLVDLPLYAFCKDLLGISHGLSAWHSFQDDDDGLEKE